MTKKNTPPAEDQMEIIAGADEMELEEVVSDLPDDDLPVDDLPAEAPPPLDYRVLLINLDPGNGPSTVEVFAHEVAVYRRLGWVPASEV